VAAVVMAIVVLKWGGEEGEEEEGV